MTSWSLRRRPPPRGPCPPQRTNSSRTDPSWLELLAIVRPGIVFAAAIVPASSRVSSLDGCRGGTNQSGGRKKRESNASKTNPNKGPLPKRDHPGAATAETAKEASPQRAFVRASSRVSTSEFLGGLWWQCSSSLPGWWEGWRLFFVFNSADASQWNGRLFGSCSLAITNETNGIHRSCAAVLAVLGSFLFEDYSIPYHTVCLPCRTMVCTPCTCASCTSGTVGTRTWSTCE